MILFRVPRPISTIIPDTAEKLSTHPGIGSLRAPVTGKKEKISIFMNYFLLIHPVSLSSGPLGHFCYVALFPDSVYVKIFLIFLFGSFVL